MKHLSFAQLEEIFRGQFDWLAAQICGAAIEPALAKIGRHVTDPVTGKPSSFRLDKHFPHNGKWYYSSPETNHGVFNLVEYVSGLTKSEIFKLANELAKNSGLVLDKSLLAQSQAEAKRRREAEKQKRALEFAQNAERIKKLFKRSCSLKDMRSWPAHRYLAERGLKLHNPAAGGQDDYPLSLGFIEKLRYYQPSDDGQPQFLGEFPALLAKVTNVEGKVITLHRIFLDKEGKGKANVPEPKKAMPPQREWRGGSVKMYNPNANGLIAVAEGVETALAVRDGTGLPVWATVHASGLALLEVPPSVKMVAIFADKDRSEAGLQAAETLKKRLKEKGVYSTILLPSMEIPEGAKGVDWLDALNSEGGKAFIEPMKTVLKMVNWVQERQKKEAGDALQNAKQAKEIIHTGDNSKSQFQQLRESYLASVKAS